MKLGTQVGLGPGHIVLDGDHLPLPKKRAEPPIFSQYLLIIIIIIEDSKSLQQELTSPLTNIQLDKIVKNTKEIMSHLVKFSK